MCSRFIRDKQKIIQHLRSQGQGWGPNGKEGQESQKARKKVSCPKAKKGEEIRSREAQGSEETSPDSCGLEAGGPAEVLDETREREVGNEG